ncbi:uncharacterized protein K02A2.6-like [Aedes albopictus]|uniref:Reverse transcriptase domain-containing protein n=1 Tax=Aedes albopictus TaxID=7160 RepID=A0ABM2A4U8_AEDAL
MEAFRPVKQFDAKVDQSQLETEWRKWKRSLEYYLTASGITGQREMRNQLLHLGGPDLQDIFDNLPGVHDVPHVTPDPPFYDIAVQKLDSHFQPCRRQTYERHVFRQIAQLPGERFGDFVMKLRVQASRCDFDLAGGTVMDTMIIDQIAEKCLSSTLRKKILEKDRPLEEVVAIGKTIEDVEQQCKELTNKDETNLFEDRAARETNKDICCVMGENRFRFKVGGIGILMTIDSGAAANLIDHQTWIKLQKGGANVRFSQHPDRSFKAYGSDRPLNITGMFTAEIEAEDQKAEAVFYIAENGKQCLLGDETAKQLKVLKIGYGVASIHQHAPTFPKIKGVLVEISIDPNVKPVQQPYRRAPFALEDKVAEKLQYLLSQDIIERVEKPSAWVSPIVPILKDNGEVRLCVDMRRANQAVIRETHPLPIVEELFGGITGATRFSKLDIKEAYHQVEISERSRGITTFITKQGLSRFKRLMLGISCAPELFQKVMESIFAGLEGVVVYLDDIMVTGRTQQEHDERLAQVMARLRQFDILLNEDKCDFNATRLEFLGHELATLTVL